MIQEAAAPKHLGLMEGVGVELEYMIVDSETLAVKPIADKLMEAAAGEPTDEVSRGAVAWNNELVQHVIEIKTAAPRSSLDSFAAEAHAEVREINSMLAGEGAMLLPGSMHPFMNPDRETKLWSQENAEIYDSFHRIFDCRGHGWANLQSVHINLSFDGAEEFGQLHAAIRTILPLLPAIAASSPICEGRVTGIKDTRLDFYRRNQRKIPSVAGKIIPEAVFTPDDYQDRILTPMYRDISPFDAEGILQNEWLNSRGAIARFDRGSIEIRLLDIQECPAADLAIVRVVVAMLRRLVNAADGSAGQRKLTTDYLAGILDETIRNAEDAVVNGREYLELFGVSAEKNSAGELWNEIRSSLESDQAIDAPTNWILSELLREGTLSTRLGRAVGSTPSKETIDEVYRDLADCLRGNRLFLKR